MIPYGRQDILQEDVDAVVRVLKSDFLTQGPVVAVFERAVSQKVGAAHGISVNCATSALHIACLALDLGPGDLLWTTPITFVASANCGIYCGAEVDFVDIDPSTYNMSPTKLAEKLHTAEKLGRLPKIIVVVHMAGRSCEMKKIGALAKKYGVKVIEDASHAIGGKYQAKYIGNCAHSDITVFSFHPVKIITTAEGGLAVTNDDKLANRMMRLRTHGVTRNPDEMTHESDGPWYYQQIELGWNYRLTEIQAALGLAQLKRLDSYVTDRNKIANTYDQAFADCALTYPPSDPAHYSAYHLYIIQLNEPARHRDIFEKLRAKKIGVNLHYIPVHLQPFYKGLGFRKGDFPCSEEYYTRAISLPLFPTMTKSQQNKVVIEMKAALI